MEYVPRPTDAPFVREPSATAAFAALSDEAAELPLPEEPVNAVVIGGGTGAPVSIRTLLKYPLAVYQSSYNIANPIRNLLEDCGTPNYQIITNSPRMYEDAILHQDCAGFINKAGLVNHAALQDILDEVIMLPVTNVPPIQMYAIVENTYLREHEQSISDFLAIYRSFC